MKIKIIANNTKNYWTDGKKAPPFDANEVKLALERLSSLSFETPKVFMVNASNS